MAGIESNPGPRHTHIVSDINKYHKDESILRSSTSNTHREVSKKSPYTDFKLLQFNCNGLRSKHPEITSYMDLNSFHVAALQETKLNGKSKITINTNYTLLRKDRVKRYGGGLAFIIHKSVKFGHLDLPPPPLDDDTTEQYGMPLR